MYLASRKTIRERERGKKKRVSVDGVNHLRESMRNKIRTKQITKNYTIRTSIELVFQR